MLNYFRKFCLARLPFLSLNLCMDAFMRSLVKKNYNTISSFNYIVQFQNKCLLLFLLRFKFSLFHSHSQMHFKITNIYKSCCRSFTILFFVGSVVVCVCVCVWSNIFAVWNSFNENNTITFTCWFCVYVDSFRKWNEQITNVFSVRYSEVHNPRHMVIVDCNELFYYFHCVCFFFGLSLFSPFYRFISFYSIGFIFPLFNEPCAECFMFKYFPIL